MTDALFDLVEGEAVIHHPPPGRAPFRLCGEHQRSYDAWLDYPAQLKGWQCQKCFTRGPFYAGCNLCRDHLNGQREAHYKFLNRQLDLIIRICKRHQEAS